MEMTQRQTIQLHGEIVDGNQKVIVHGSYAANKRLDLSVEVLDASYVQANSAAVSTSVLNFIEEVYSAAAAAGLPVARPAQ